MPRISLTDLVDVVSKSGTPKATKVSEIKNRKSYEPAFDFYKPLRDHIIRVHRDGMKKSDLDLVMDDVDEKRKTAYEAIIKGYKSWWGKKTVLWSNPKSGIFSDHGIDVSVNPELNLKVNGTRYLIKLYFKGDPLAKNKIDIITHVMHATLGGDAVMSVLDLRRSKLIAPTVPIVHLDAVLSAELAYVAALWGKV